MDSWIEFFRPYASIAPIGTVAFAFFAVLVALWTLSTQKRIARGRATIDFFLKTEMDASMLGAYKDYTDAIQALKTAPSMAVFKATNHYQAVRLFGRE